MPNKETGRGLIETRGSSGLGTSNTRGNSTNKNVNIKGSPLAMATPAVVPMSAEDTREELLGSLTTQQQQRTSARVIKKLRLDSAPDEPERERKAECEGVHKLDEEQKEVHKLSVVKQRMPKALWSPEEKSLFFEGLNEYGKDFDAITSYICAKLKKKGGSYGNMKTKHQVSHFYYRTWHKLSKHLHFDENVKKVAQELYALINYGEARRRLSSVSERTCARLAEMVARGSLAVRARGRTVRLRTPPCRALRRLNMIAEGSEMVVVGGRATVSLRARDSVAWARVQAAAHNPRAQVVAPLRTPLACLIAALEARWRGRTKHNISNTLDIGSSEMSTKYAEDLQKNRESNPDECSSKTHCQANRAGCSEKQETLTEDLESHLNLEPDRIIVLESQKKTKLALHVGPRPDAEIHLPTVHMSEPLSSQTICFSSYLKRIGNQNKDSCGSKIRTPKRQRKDSGTEKDPEAKKSRQDESELPVDIDDTAVDGIELMASLSEARQEDAKIKDEDPKEQQDAIIEDDVIREKDEIEISEKEKDSFSELEEDDKYNESDNESDGGAKNEQPQHRKFKNLKVKFRISKKERRGNVYDLITYDQCPKVKRENIESCKLKNDTTEVLSSVNKDKTETVEQCAKDKVDAAIKVENEIDNAEDIEKDSGIDLDMAMKQIRKGWSVYDTGQLTIGDIYLMFGSKSKLQLDYWWAEPTPPLPPKKNITQSHKAPTNNNTIEVNTDKVDNTVDKSKQADKTEKAKVTEVKVEKVKLDPKLPDKSKENRERGIEKTEGFNDLFEDDKGKLTESDSDMFSPKNTFSQDSNDGVSGDERKGEQLASPEHRNRADNFSSPFLIINKLVNRVDGPPTTHSDQIVTLSSRLRRLLALAGVGGSGAGAVRPCACPHTCGQRPRRPAHEVQKTVMREEFDMRSSAPTFRHPQPIAPKPANNQQLQPMCLEGLPKYRRGGRPARAGRRAQGQVVQRLLPLLPKPTHHGVIPVKIQSTSQMLPKLAPKLSSTDTTGTQCNKLKFEDGSIYMYEGELHYRETPDVLENETALRCVSVSKEPTTDTKVSSAGTKAQDSFSNLIPVKVLSATNKPSTLDPNLPDTELANSSFTGSPSVSRDFKLDKKADIKLERDSAQQKVPQNDPLLNTNSQDTFSNFLPAESLTLSPSRLLREVGDGDAPWLEAGVQDFSLSSFLGHLEGASRPPDAVETQLQCMMAESSIDYMAKFAALAEQVVDDPLTPATPSLSSFSPPHL